jgi:hypothetical protein
VAGAVGAAGTLIGWGIPEERVKHYESGIKEDAHERHTLWGWWLKKAARVGWTSTDTNVALLSAGMCNEIVGVAMHRLCDLQGRPPAQLAGNRSGFYLSPLEAAFHQSFCDPNLFLSTSQGVSPGDWANESGAT